MDLVNHEAEMSVLGALLTAPESLDDIGPLFPEDFADKRHSHVLQAILALSEHDEPADLVTVTAELRKRGALDHAGGAAYLSELVDFFPAVATLPHYTRLVRESAARRRLAETARELNRLAHEAETPGEALDQAEAALLKLRRNTSAGGATAVGTLLPHALKDFDRLQIAGGCVTGVPTGFHSLDALTSGLQPGDLILVAGRPSMGKTALGLNMTEHAAEMGRRTLFFSLEMSKALLTRRLIASIARVDSPPGQDRPAFPGRLAAADWRGFRADPPDAPAGRRR